MSNNTDDTPRDLWNIDTYSDFDDDTTSHITATVDQQSSSNITNTVREKLKAPTRLSVETQSHAGSSSTLLPPLHPNVSRSLLDSSSKSFDGILDKSHDGESCDNINYSSPKRITSSFVEDEKLVMSPIPEPNLNNTVVTPTNKEVISSPAASQDGVFASNPVDIISESPGDNTFQDDSSLFPLATMSSVTLPPSLENYGDVLNKNAGAAVASLESPHEHTTEEATAVKSLEIEEYGDNEDYSSDDDCSDADNYTEYTGTDVYSTYEGSSIIGDSGAASSVGPIAMVAARQAKEEIAREEAKWKAIRGFAPNKAPDPRNAIKKLKEQVAAREELNKKRAETSGSLLQRVNTRNEASPEKVVSTGVARSLFWASQDGADQVVEDVEQYPQHHSVVNKTVKAKKNVVLITDESMLMMTPQKAAENKLKRILSVGGLFGLILCILGNIFVNATCHYIAVDLEYESEANWNEFYFGMWKYTPIDSVHAGHKFCSAYDESFINDKPLVSSICGIGAFLLCIFGMIVLFTYVKTGEIDQTTWTVGLSSLFLAGLCHIAMLFMIFTSSLCKFDISGYKRQCSMARGSFVGSFMVFIHFALAIFMWKFNPLLTRLSASNKTNLLTNLPTNISPKKKENTKPTSLLEISKKPKKTMAATTGDKYVPPLV